MNTWVGRPADDVVRRYGAPERTYTFTNGNKLIGYRLDTSAEQHAGPEERLFCDVDFEVGATSLLVERFSYTGSCSAR